MTVHKFSLFYIMYMNLSPLICLFLEKVLTSSLEEISKGIK